MNLKPLASVLATATGSAFALICERQPAATNNPPRPPVPTSYCISCEFFNCSLNGLQWMLLQRLATCDWRQFIFWLLPASVALAVAVAVAFSVALGSTRRAKQSHKRKTSTRMTPFAVKDFNYCRKCLSAFTKCTQNSSADIECSFIHFDSILYLKEIKSFVAFFVPSHVIDGHGLMQRLIWHIKIAGNWRFVRPQDWWCRTAARCQLAELIG